MASTPGSGVVRTSSMNAGSVRETGPAGTATTDSTAIVTAHLAADPANRPIVRRVRRVRGSVPPACGGRRSCGTDAPGRRPAPSGPRSRRTPSRRMPTTQPATSRRVHRRATHWRRWRRRSRWPRWRGRHDDRRTRSRAAPRATSAAAAAGRGAHRADRTFPRWPARSSRVQRGWPRPPGFATPVGSADPSAAATRSSTHRRGHPRRRATRPRAMSPARRPASPTRAGCGGGRPARPGVSTVSGSAGRDDRRLIARASSGRQVALHRAMPTASAMRTSWLVAHCGRDGRARACRLFDAPHRPASAVRSAAAGSAPARSWRSRGRDRGTRSGGRRSWPHRRPRPRSVSSLRSEQICSSTSPGVRCGIALGGPGTEAPIAGYPPARNRPTSLPTQLLDTPCARATSR